MKRLRDSIGSKRFALYLRCSTDEQADKEYSTIDSQKAINEAFVAGKGGIVSGVYTDEGRTGTNLNRPGWKLLLADAQSRLFDTVVITYMSRLGRGESFTIARYELEKHGVSVATVKESFGDGMQGYVSRTMQNLMDGMYPVMVSGWTKTKLDAMFEQGFFCGGVVPFGYCLIPVVEASFGSKEPPKKLTPNNDAPLVRAAFETFLSTGQYEPVADLLRNATTLYWDKTKAKRLLTNRVYRGHNVRNGVVKHDNHEPIISEGLWDMVQEVLAECNQDQGKRVRYDRSDKQPFYLRGIVYCSHCGCRMSPANCHGSKARVRYYTCLKGVKLGKGACPIQRVNAHNLHDAIVYEIQRAAQHPSRLEAIIREAVKLLPITDRLKDQAVAVSRRLAAKEREIEQITSAIATIGASPALIPLVKKLETLEGERATLAQESARIEREIGKSEIRRPDTETVQGLYQRFFVLWEAATEPEREKLLPLLVERVEMTNREEGNVCLLFSNPLLRGECCDTTPKRDDYTRSYNKPPNPARAWIPFKALKGGKNRKQRSEAELL